MSIKIIRILLGIAIFFYSCKSTKKQDNCESIYRDLNSELLTNTTQSDSLKSLSRYEIKLTNYAFCKDVYSLIADSYFKLNEENSALKNYLYILKIDSTDIHALFNVSLILYNRDMFDSSIKILTKILDNKTGNNFSMDVNNGIQDIAKIHDIPTEEIRYYLALNYYYKGNLQLAMYNFNYCEQKRYDLKNVHIYKGSIYLETQKNAKACEEFKLAKELGNSDAIKYINQYCNGVSN